MVSDESRDDIAGWRCPRCGTEYIRDVGRCGQLQPFDCDGIVEPIPAPRVFTDAEVVAALRIAIEAAATAEAARAVTVELLALAPDSDLTATAPVEALITAIRAAGLGFEVTGP